MKGPSVLVTGGTGSLGRHVIREALEAGCHVVAPVRALNEAEAWRRLRASVGPEWMPTCTTAPSTTLKPVACDLRDEACVGALCRALERSCAGGGYIGGVVHCAASDSYQHGYDALRAVNVRGTQHIVHVAAMMRPVSGVHHVSSCATRLVEQLPPYEGLVSAPQHGLLTPYAVTKWEGERLCLAAHDAVRCPTAVYDIGYLWSDDEEDVDDNNVLELMWKLCYRAGAVFEAPEGSDSIDMTHCRTVAQFLVRAATQQSAPQYAGSKISLQRPDPLRWNQSIARMALPAVLPTVEILPYDRWLSRCHDRWSGSARVGWLRRLLVPELMMQAGQLFEPASTLEVGTVCLDACDVVSRLRKVLRLRVGEGVL